MFFVIFAVVANIFHRYGDDTIRAIIMMAISMAGLVYAMKKITPMLQKDDGRKHDDLKHIARQLLEVCNNHKTAKIPCC